MCQVLAEVIFFLSIKIMQHWWLNKSSLRTARVGLAVKTLGFFYLVLVMGAASICVWFFSMPRLLFGHLSRRWMVVGPAGSWSLMWEIMYQNGFIDGWPTDGWDISLGGRVGTAQWSIWWKMFSIILCNYRTPQPTEHSKCNLILTGIWALFYMHMH